MKKESIKSTETRMMVLHKSKSRDFLTVIPSFLVSVFLSNPTSFLNL